jgi:hypothetical protein
VKQSREEADYVPKSKDNLEDGVIPVVWHRKLYLPVVGSPTEQTLIFESDSLIIETLQAPS